MAFLFGVRRAAAALARMSVTGAERFQGLVEVVCPSVKATAVKHLDETGFRIGGKTQWRHVAVTLWLTLTTACPPSGASLLEGLEGIVVMITGNPTLRWRASCLPYSNAHHLRELKALIEIDKAHWALRMQRPLRRACHATNLAHERDEPLTLPRGSIPAKL